MKLVVFACVMVCLLAVSPIEKYAELARQDSCVSKVLDYIQPLFNAKFD